MKRISASLIAIFFSLLMISTAEAAFRLQLENASYTQTQQTQILSFFREIEDLLPLRVKQQINRSIEIKFKNFTGNQVMSTPKCQGESEASFGKGILGQVPHKNLIGNLTVMDLSKLKVIELDISVLSEILQGPEKARNFPCSHGSTYKIAQAVLLHEISHLYDYMNFQSELNQADLATCNSFPRSVRNDFYVCKELANTSRSVSEHPYFRHLVGWIEKGLLFQNWTVIAGPLRTPDPYEYDSPEEAFGVNFEFFILDPTYKCRRPVHYAYFKTQLQHEPYAQFACKPYREALLDTESSKAQVTGRLQITTENLYSIDYLWAAEGEAIMSQWGHAMFRLVYCRPGRAKGPDCRQDLAYHYVISYRAQIEDVQINPLSGLRGDYPTKMYLLAMTDVVSEYTKNEFRDLISLPLNLNPQEQQRFVDRALEHYWTYQGAYYFLSNNCATEALSLLKAARYDAQLQRLHVNTPLGLYDALVARRMIDDSIIFKDPEQAKKFSYLIPGADANLQKSFEVLLAAQSPGQKWSFADMKSFVQNTAMAERKAFYFGALQNMRTKVEKTRVLGASLLLESQVERNIESALLARLNKVLFDYMNGLTPTGKEHSFVGTKLEEWRKLSRESKANAYFSVGYGIPLKHEVEKLQQEKEKLAKVDMPDLNKEIIEWAKKNLPEENSLWQQSTELRGLLIKTLTSAMKDSR